MKTEFKTETVLEHAAIAAAYLRTLLAEGVAISSAVALTGSYISSLQIIAWGSKEPTEPWQE